MWQFLHASRKLIRCYCKKKIASDTTFEFFGTVPRFHVYREIWRPFEDELLKFDFENENLFDMFVRNQYI